MIPRNPWKHLLRESLLVLLWWGIFYALTAVDRRPFSTPMLWALWLSMAGLVGSVLRVGWQLWRCLRSLGAPQPPQRYATTTRRIIFEEETY